MSSDSFDDATCVACVEHEAAKHDLQYNISRDNVNVYYENNEDQVHCDVKDSISYVTYSDSVIPKICRSEKNQNVIESCVRKTSELTGLHELCDDEGLNRENITAREKLLNSHYETVHSASDLVIKLKSVPNGGSSLEQFSRNNVEYDCDQHSAQAEHRYFSDSGRNSLSETDDNEYVSSQERAKRRKPKRLWKMFIDKKSGYRGRYNKKHLIDRDPDTTMHSNKDDSSEHHQSKDSGMESSHPAHKSAIEARQHRGKYKVRSWTKCKMKEQVPFKCSLCDKILQSRGSLNVHINLHKSDRPFLCTYCGQAFKTKGILKSHTMTHTDLKPQLCTYCARQFRTKYQLDSHIACVHLNLKPFQCNLCKKDFAKRMTLVSHMLTHSQERTFKCETCSQTFTHRQGLHIHQKRHTGAKPYTCKFCGKRFGQSSNLRRHERTHTGIRPFICPICHRSYAQQNDVPRHMKKVHGVLNPPTIQAVNEFETTVPDEVLPFPVPCIVSLQTAKVVPELLNNPAISGHLTTTMGVDHFTGDDTTSKQKLNDSIKPAQCLSCGKWFKNENRLSVHRHKACGGHKPGLDTEKTYTCGMCGDIFNKQYQLNKHMKTHLGDPVGVPDAKPQPESNPTLCPGPATNVSQYMDAPSTYQHSSLEDRENKVDLLSLAHVPASVPCHWVPYHEQPHFAGGVSSQFNHATPFLHSFTRMDQSLDNCTQQLVQHQPQPAIYSNPVLQQGVSHYHTSLFSDQTIGSWPPQSSQDQQHEHPGHNQEHQTHGHNQRQFSQHQNQHEQSRYIAQDQEQLPPQTNSQQQNTSHTLSQQQQCHKQHSQHQEHEPNMLLPHNHHFNQRHQQETQSEQHQHQQQQPVLTILNCENVSKPNVSVIAPTQSVTDTYYLSASQVNSNNNPVESYSNDNCMSFDDESDNDPENESINYDAVLESVIGSIKERSLQNTAESSKSVTHTTISSHSLQASMTSTSINLLSDKKQECNSDYLKSARDSKKVHQERSHLTSSSVMLSEGSHEDRVIQNKPYRCMTCGARFVRKDTLETHSKTHYGEGSQQCSECGKMFVLVESLRIHMSFHRGGFGVRVCETCGESLSSFNELQRHKRVFHKLTDRRRFACDICGAVYKYNVSLQNHKYTHTGAKPYLCLDCGRGFRSNSNLTAHRKVHSDSKPFVCNVCNVGFKAHIRLHKHMETHLAKSLRTAQFKDFVKTVNSCELPAINDNDRSRSKNISVSGEINERTTERVNTTIQSAKINVSMNEPNLLPISLEANGRGHKQLHCPVCNRLIVVSRKLLRGSGVHKSEGSIGNYECGTCNKRFICSSTYRSHLRCHTGERPYKCDICQKCFTQIGNLFRHKLIHSDLKPFVCPICELGFRQKMNMQRHLVVTHGILNIDGQEVRIHLNKTVKHRGQSETSEIHDLATVDKSGKATDNTEAIKMSSILATNPPGIMECEYCKKIFIYRVHLDAHMRTHTGERPYSCQTCGKAFTQQANLDKHQRVHTGEKPFACPVCGKTFSQKQNMQKHEQIHNDKERAFSCSICAKQFVKKLSMVKHEKSHHKPSPAKTKLRRNKENLRSADACTLERTYISRPRRVKTKHKCLEIKSDDDDDLSKDENKKIKDRSLAGQECSKLYQEDDKLISQISTTNNKQQNVCALCKKSFTSKRQLDRHMLIHSHDKTYFCIFCNKLYKQSSLLTRHMKSCRKHKKSYKKSNDTTLHDDDVASTDRVMRSSERFTQGKHKSGKRDEIEEANISKPLKGKSNATVNVHSDVISEAFPVYCIKVEHLAQHDEEMKPDADAEVTCEESISSYAPPISS